MKKITSILSLILCLILFLIPFSTPVSAAESLNDLKKIYNNLTLYIVDSFFDDSQYYDAFKEKLAEVGELLKQDDITQTDIDTYYTDIKKAYSDMMRDTFDYSSLDILVKDYESMDKTIFTEESWRRLESIMGTVHHELDAPSLFQMKSTDTEEDYRNTTKRHITKFTTDYFAAYNRLELIDFTQNPITVDQLKGVIHYCSVTAREDLMGDNPHWRYYKNAVQEANYCSNLYYPSQDRLNKALEGLLDAYHDLCSASLDLTPIKTQISRYSTLTGQSYSTASWARYSEAIRSLKEEIESNHFIYFSASLTPEECKERIALYLNTLCIDSENYYNTLISIERYDHLKKLCNDNRNATSMDGLEIKLNRLLSRVSEGDAVLQNPEAVPAEVESAIANLESARTDLNLAEYFLKEEQSKVLKQDVQTIRLIVIFTILSIALALIFACVVSYHFYGRIDWKK